MLRYFVVLLLGASSKWLWRSGSETPVEDVKGGTLPSTAQSADI